MEKTFKQLLKTTEQYIQILKTGGISTPQELLWYLPRTYEDRTQIKTIDQLVRDGTVQTVKVEITKKSMITTPKRKKLIQMTGVDEKGQTVHLGFLNMTYVLRNTKTKQRYYVVGSPIYDKSKRTYRHPELVPAQAPSPSEEHKVGSIYPIYSELQGISAGRFHKKIYEHLDELLVHITDPLPPAFLQKYHLPDLPAALRELHAPQDLAAVEHAQSRIYFGKLLQRQLISLTHKLSYQQPKTTDQPDREGIKGFLSHLPFELTKAQKKSLKEIIDDLHSGRSMLRLLQGDVGSGKTIVAAVAAWYIITKNKGQAVFLAPLEVLAQQQYRSLAKLLLPLGVRVELLTGSSKPSEKKRIKQ
ncbi:MAG: DEAD/DEAH box helicase [bacterium]|nr:DEAD/DEAH box helicase [bacterium]